MPHYILELALWLLLAYVVGCLVGWALRNIVGQGASQPAIVAAAPVSSPTPAAPTPTPAPRSEPVRIATPTPLPAAAPVASGKMVKPKGIAAARGGKADNLQRISGIGPKNEGILNNLGIYHFDQIAAWTPEQITWVDDHLRFNGRIQREEWIRQAHLLSEGKEAEFKKEFGTGGLKNKQGETVSGTHTRKN
jgi:NADH-quinone oxidoreductase subunit E